MITLHEGDAVWIEDGYAETPHAAVIAAVSPDGTVYAESARRVKNDSRVVQWTIQPDHVARMISPRTEH